VWVLVTHIESGETESLGGIEDSDYRYIREVRDELADIINGRLDDEMAEEIEESRPDMRCMPDPDQIAIPPYLDCDHN
jgi:hypothetical protein